MGVVGLGHFAQVAILPAFRHLDDVELTALVSSTPAKLTTLRDRYHVPITATYEQFDDLLASGDLDAVYIALPNDLHAPYTVKACRAGVHVLCEKPMAPSEDECRAMLEAAAAADVRLMIAYRLHFEAANLTAVDLVQSGKLGAPRIFSSVFCQQVRDRNVRVQPRAGAGPLYDIGVYCVNAARYLFRDEPVAVSAATCGDRSDPRFRHVDEAMAVTMRFPNDELAIFTISFGAHDRSHYEVVCTDGVVQLDHAYEYTEEIKLTVENGVGPRVRTFQRRDQIGAEIAYFARCVRERVDPEPSGLEGLADVRILEAIQRAAASGRIEEIEPLPPPRRPDLDQAIRVPPHAPPRVIDAESAST